MNKRYWNEKAASSFLFDNSELKFVPIQKPLRISSKTKKKKINLVINLENTVFNVL